MSRTALDEQYAAGLATHDRYVNGNLQLGQLAQANLALAEKDSEINARRQQMQRDAGALVSATQAIGRRKGGELSIDSLRLRQDFMRGSLEVAKAQDDRQAFAAAQAAIDRSISRYDELLKVLSEAPLLKALNSRIATAFVPYENIGNAHVGSAVFACRVGMLACRKVGQVKNILSGEVSAHSPIESRNVRGLMLELALDDTGRSVEDQVLFLNHAPLYF
jgi:hypothetical protein